MRLIDADALMADLEKWLKQIDPTHPSEDNAIPPMDDIIVSTLMTIEEQPTIKPQRIKGRWIDGQDVPNRRPLVHLFDYKYCSVCHNEAYCDTDYGQQLFDYCPYCGADMKGKQNETN